jgi:hypothetical protein
MKKPLPDMKNPSIYSSSRSHHPGQVQALYPSKNYEVSHIQTERATPLENENLEVSGSSYTVSNSDHP